MKDKEIHTLKRLLHQPVYEAISMDFRRSMHTLRQHLRSIENSFMYHSITEELKESTIKSNS